MHRDGVAHSRRIPHAHGIGRLAAALLAGAAVLLGLAGPVAGAPAEPDLAALQLVGTEVGPIVKWPPDPAADLTVSRTLTAPMTGTDGTDEPQCAGAIYSGVDRTYDGSGYTEFNYQELTGTGKTTTYAIVSVASAYADEATAADLVARTTQTWSDCARHKVTGDLDGAAETRTVSNIMLEQGSVTVVNNRSGEADGACSHTMAHKQNVVVEVSACRSNIGLFKQGQQLTNKMLVKLPL